MKNAKCHSLLFLALSVACILFVGQCNLQKLLVLIPLCLLVTLVSFAYEERKISKAERERISKNGKIIDAICVIRGSIDMTKRTLIRENLSELHFNSKHKEKSNLLHLCEINRIEIDNILESLD